MNFDDLIAELAPPKNRRGKSKDDREHRFYEGAVMLAYAMHLLRTESVKEVHIHPDGMHGKQFDFSAWLKRHGFQLMSRTGKTLYGGSYTDAGGRMIVINPTSGHYLDIWRGMADSAIACGGEGRRATRSGAGRPGAAPRISMESCYVAQLPHGPTIST